MLRKDFDHQPRQMDNMNCIVKSNDQKGSIWLGNIQAAQSQNELKRHRIGATLSLCPIDQDPHQIMHLVINAEDRDDYDISIYFDQTYNFLEQARNITNVLIHCQAGISRSTTVLLAYLVKKDLIGVREAYQLIENKRWQIYPNNG